MKYLIASDIHGSALYAQKLMKKFEESGAQKLILLGDILYHGPRNDLPEGHDCPNVWQTLNAHSDKIFAIRGNCDSEVDQSMLNFPMMGEYALVEIDGLSMFLSHGHRWNPSNLPPLKSCNTLLYGHTHIPEARHADGMFFINPGSVSLPRGGFAPSYAVYESGVFEVLDFDGNRICALDTGEYLR